MQRRIITILGGGFSGSMLAVQLSRLPGGPYDCDVHLVEPRPILGPGLAYTARRPEYLLNVRAAHLSAFPDDPDHFTNWVKSSHTTLCEDNFCPRQLYGRYLQEMVTQTLAQPADNGMQFSWHPQAGVGVSISPEGNSATVRFSSGRELRTDMVVLALGNFPPAPPAGPDLSYLSHPNYHSNPWASGALRNIGINDTVLLIGSGLTAVDMLLGMRTDGHRGKIKVVSSHMRWPSVHGHVCKPYPSLYDSELKGLTTVLEVLRTVRRHMRQANLQGTDWRPIIDSLRKDASRIWAAWPLDEQARFLRHLAPLWNLLRHRSPPQNAATMRDMVGAGLVTMQVGKVKQITEQAGQLAVQVQANNKTEWLTAQHVICCTGPLLDYSRIADPLVKNLREAGQLVPDPLRLGIVTNEHGALINDQQQVSEVFFTLGPSRRPTQFEATAVPELRLQALELARHLGQLLAGKAA